MKELIADMRLTTWSVEFIPCVPHPVWNEFHTTFFHNDSPLTNECPAPQTAPVSRPYLFRSPTHTMMPLITRRSPLVRSRTRVMRAAVIAAPRLLEIEETPLPEPGHDQVRVRLEGCGVCASNIPVWEGREWFEYPRPPGSPGPSGGAAARGGW